MANFGDCTIFRTHEVCSEVWTSLIDEFRVAKLQEDETVYEFRIPLYSKDGDSGNWIVSDDLAHPGEVTEDDLVGAGTGPVVARAEFTKRLLGALEDMRKMSGVQLRLAWSGGTQSIVTLSTDGQEDHTLLGLEMLRDGGFGARIVSVKWDNAEGLRELFGLAGWVFERPDGDNALTIKVWWKDRYGWGNRDVSLACQPLGGYMRTNYDDKVCEKTDVLLDRIESGSMSGKLIVCHGAPGTGKSYWLRGLAYALKGKYEICYISECDEFLGGASGYYSVIDDIHRPALLIFEDAGKVFTVGAQTEYPNLTTTLLNLTSGLISAGRKDIFVFTYNGDMGELDEAMLRPGRALSVIEFAKLPVRKCRAFLDEHGCGERASEIKSGMPLADLYAMVYGTDDMVREKKGRVGLR